MIKIKDTRTRWKTGTLIQTPEQSIKKLEELLDTIKEMYDGKLEVIDGTVDITGCFYKKSKKRWSAPKSWDIGKNPKRVVLGYAVKGSEKITPLFKKYDLTSTKSGLVHYWTSFDATLHLGAILCIQGMENTSLFEVYDPIKREPFNVPVVQGFTSGVIDNIVSKLQKEYGSFNPSVDSFFMFYNNKESATIEVNLNKLWLSQILEYGSQATYTMDDSEADLFESFIGKEKLESMLKDFRIHNIASQLPEYVSTHGKKAHRSSYAQTFAYNKTVAYIKNRGITPTIYVPKGNYAGEPVKEGKYVKLETSEVGILISRRTITKEIASRPAVNPFSFL
ncbi:hypothetical protein KY347_06050 [Candidatus Woesearchaeota archaeon]|nr:hypothetical protein [Candidatus Woesearchaeota archaeon]